MTEPRKPSKEELFARGFLSGIGLSPEYAAIIAERIMVPGTKLSPSDAEYLRLVQRGMGMVAGALGRS